MSAVSGIPLSKNCAIHMLPAYGVILAVMSERMDLFLARSQMLATSIGELNGALDESLLQAHTQRDKLSDCLGTMVRWFGGARCSMGGRPRRVLCQWLLRFLRRKQPHRSQASISTIKRSMGLSQTWRLSSKSQRRKARAISTGLTLTALPRWWHSSRVCQLLSRSSLDEVTVWYHVRDEYILPLFILTASSLENSFYSLDDLLASSFRRSRLEGMRCFRLQRTRNRLINRTFTHVPLHKRNRAAISK
eukprot:scaffold1108_cov387-Prasinococcus_capsulatus_cf.AAC.2